MNFSLLLSFRCGRRLSAEKVGQANRLNPIIPRVPLKILVIYLITRGCGCGIRSPRRKWCKFTSLGWTCIKCWKDELFTLFLLAWTRIACRYLQGLACACLLCKDLHDLEELAGACMTCRDLHGLIVSIDVAN